MALEVLQAPPGWVAPRYLWGGDPGEGYQNPETRTKAVINAHIIVMCMGIGWGEITEANAVDWHRRARSYEIATDGAMRRVDNGERVPMPLTLAMVRERIGLRVNVFGPKGYKELTDAAFARKLAKALADTVDREVITELRDSGRLTEVGG